MAEKKQGDIMMNMMEISGLKMEAAISFKAFLDMSNIFAIL